MFAVGQVAYIPKANPQEVLREHFLHGVVGMTGLPRKMPGAMRALAK
jgi:hypothetical protein